jgi:hypothetical protein
MQRLNSEVGRSAGHYTEHPRAGGELMVNWNVVEERGDYLLHEKFSRDRKRPESTSCVPR